MVLPAMLRNNRPLSPGTEHDQFVVPWHSSLVFKSLFSIFVLLCFIIGIAGWYSIHKMHNQALYDLAQDSRYVAKISANAVALPLWNIDNDQVSGQLKALSSGQSFCGARVIDEGGELFANEGFAEQIGHNHIVYKEDILFEAPSTGKMQKIGVLELCTSAQYMEQKLAASVRTELFFFALITLSVLIACYFAIFIIVAPLLSIRSAMEDLDETLDPIRDERLLRRNEIGAMSFSFNRMVGNLSQSYNALKKAKEEAVKADLAKTEFLANISHELRTPLNIIIGMTQLLKEEQIDEDQRHSFDIVKKSSQTLLHIVDDILDLSRIEAGELRLEQVPFNLTHKIAEIVKAHKTLADTKKIYLSLKNLDQDFMVMGDPVRFGQIIGNLVNNAVRYTEKGGVSAEFSIRQKSDYRLIVACSISDTGIGIAEDKLASVFEKFSQGDNSNKRVYGGAGLGLTITKHLLALMGGEIKVASKPGKGSTFSFEMPFILSRQSGQVISANADKTRYSAAKKPADARVLIVEDNPMNQILMQKVLVNLGIGTIKVVANGVEAVSEVHNMPYDLILMDYSMPLMNGAEATLCIRASDNNAIKDIPIVAVTANALVSDKDLCESAGMDAYISKPFQLDFFKKTISRWIDLS